MYKPISLVYYLKDGKMVVADQSIKDKTCILVTQKNSDGTVDIIHSEYIEPQENLEEYVKNKYNITDEKVDKYGVFGDNFE